MAAPEQLDKMALKLAKLDRKMVATPFSRRNSGKWAFFEDQQREGVLHAVHDIYNFAFAMHNDPLPAERKRPEEYLDRPGRISINHLRRWMEIWAVTYANEPTRVFFKDRERLDNSDPVVAALQELYRDADIDCVLSDVDKDLYLYANEILRPFWDEESNELVIHCHKSFDARVIPNRQNPRNPWATVLLGDEMEFGADGAWQKIPCAEIWTAETYRFLRGSEIIEQENLDSPPPLVHCFNSNPNLRTGYWLEALGIPLAALTVRMSEDGYGPLFEAILNQAIGMMQVFGAVQGGIEVGVKRAMHFPDPESGARAEYIQSGADLMGFIDGIKYIVDTIRESFGIPQSMLSVEVDASGAAIIQANGPIAEIRKARAKVFRNIERDLLRAILYVVRGRVDGIPATLDPEAYDVSVFYEPPQASASVQDMIAQETHDLDLGITTPAEILMRRRPDMFDDVEEAQKFIEENQERRMEGVKALTEAMGPFEPNPDPEDEKSDEPDIDETKEEE